MIVNGLGSFFKGFVSSLRNLKRVSKSFQFSKPFWSFVHSTKPFLGFVASTKPFLNPRNPRWFRRVPFFFQCIILFIFFNFHLFTFSTVCFFIFSIFYFFTLYLNLLTFPLFSSLLFFCFSLCA